jgi:integrase
MASIEELEDGRYLVRWRDPDGRQRKAVFNRKRAAEDHQKEVEDCKRAGKRWEPRDARPSPGVGEAVSAHLVHLKGRGVAPRTLINVGFALENFTRFLGDADSFPLTSLSSEILERFYAWLGQAETGRHGRVRSLDTRRKNVAIVQRFWAWCANSDSYAAIVPPPRKLERLPGDARTPTRAPTWAEMDAEITAAGTWYPVPMALMRCFGLRVSQAMRLIVGDIDLEHAHLRVRGELGKSPQERQGRVVPIAPAVLPVLAELVRDRAADEWIVPSRRKRGRREREVRTEYVAGAWARAEVRDEAWRRRPDHAFRKGFVSELRRAGAERDAVEVLVGHSLGLAGIYTDPDALPLKHAVTLIPALSAEARTAVSAAFTSTRTALCALVAEESR